MKVLVTGGAGFIGSHLVKALARKGDDVVVMDKVYGYDIRDYDAVKIFMKGTECVYHLAALSNDVLCKKNPDEAKEVNIAATNNLLLEVAKRDARFVFASSAAVYGKSFGISNEEDMPDPQTLYGQTKLYSEHYCKYLDHMKSHNNVCLRLFNVYGEGGTGFINLILNAVANKRVFNIIGDGEQVRDFIHVDDVVDAFILAGNKSELAGIFNIGTGIGKTINDIYQTEIGIIGFTSKIRYKKGDPGVLFSIADNKKALDAGLLPCITPLNIGILKLVGMNYESK